MGGRAVKASKKSRRRGPVEAESSETAAPEGVVGEADSHLRAADSEIVAAVAVVAGVAGLLSLIPGLPVGVAAVFGGLLALAGPGALVVAWLPAVPRPLAAVAVPGLGLAMFSLIATAELAVGQFHARLTTALVAAVVIGGGAALMCHSADGPGQILGRIRDHCRDRIRVVPRKAPGAAVIASAAASAGAVVCAAVAMARMPSSTPTDFGPLLRVPELALAAVLTAIAFGAALWARSLGAAWVAVVVAVLVQRGPTLFPTETALYEWTYRHLGVIDWFVRVGHYERDVDVYNNWPAAMALGAWFVDSTGVDPLSLAHGFQFGYHLLLVPVAYALGRCAGLDRFGAVAGAFVIEVASWVAQDYLSPQAFAYLLAALAVAALLVTTSERFRVAGVVIGLTSATAVFWAHQLTPIWLIVVVAVLAALRLVRPRWIVLLLLLLYVPSIAVNLESIITNASTFTFNPLENTQGNVRTVGSTGQRVTSAVVKALSATMWAAALMIVAIRSRGGRSWRTDGTATLAIVGFSPFIFLLLSYGGETVFRVFLFSLLGCGLLLGDAIAQLMSDRAGKAGKKTATRAVGATVALAVLALMGLQGFLGGWYALRFTSDDVEMARRIEQNAGTNGSVVPLEYAYPIRSTWIYLPQARNDALADARWDLHDDYVGTDGSDPGPAQTFTRDVEDLAADRPVYVVVTGPIRNFVDYFRILRPGGVDRVVGHLRADGWEVVLEDNGTLVLANPAGRAAWQ